MANKNIKTPKTLTFIENEVKKYVESRDLDLKFHQIQNYSYELRDNTNPFYFTSIHSGKNIPVIMLKSGFFLYFSISYVHDGKKFLPQEISMQFFDKQQTLLFRAEISLVEDSMGVIWHPQPHWHIGARGFVDKKVPTSFQQYASQQSGFLSSHPNNEIGIDFGRIHLPMDINTKINDKNERWNETDAKDWVQNVLEIVNYELDFVTK